MKKSELVKLIRETIREETNTKYFSDQDLAKLKPTARKASTEIYNEFKSEFESGKLDKTKYDVEGILTFINTWANWYNMDVASIIKYWDWREHTQDLGLEEKESWRFK